AATFLIGLAFAARQVSSSVSVIPTRPNVIFVLSDDQGIGEVSITPGRTNLEIQTPHIDALLRSGMMFTNGYATPVCAPSRTALLTSKHLGHASIRGNLVGNGTDLALPADEITFLQVLQQNQYKISCIGKWGVGNVGNIGAPWLKGCDSFMGVLGQGGAHSMYPTTNIVAYDPVSGPTYLDFPENAGATRERCMAEDNNCTWTQKLFTDATVAELEAHTARQGRQRAAARNAAAAGGAANSTTAAVGSGGVEPFFLLLCLTTPHAGHWAAKQPSGFPVSADGRFVDEEWPDVEKDHASVIENHLDYSVGRIIRRLEKLGLTESTAVFFTSDNGATNEGDGHSAAFFGSSGPLTGYKRFVNEGGIRVPLGVSWPGVIPVGTVDVPVAIWDCGPTILAMAGVPRVEWPPGIDGPAAVAAQATAAALPAVYEHPPLYWEFCTTYRPSDVKRQGAGWSRAVRDGRWKALWFFKEGVDSAPRLYDLDADVAETDDVAAAHPDVVARLTAFADAAHVDNAYFPAVDNCQPS
ncbi:unnamed protein product, partial [Phaeothamnion confervicola]